MRFTLMIRSFRHKGLADLFANGTTSRIDRKMHKRILDALDAAIRPSDLNIPGYRFRELHGSPTRYPVHVNGPWCITFDFHGENATRVDFEQYH
jgi:toxin HigB-1